MNEIKNEATELFGDYARIAALAKAALKSAAPRARQRILSTREIESCIETHARYVAQYPGETIYSKEQLNRFPEDGEVLALLSSR